MSGAAKAVGGIAGMLGGSGGSASAGTIDVGPAVQAFQQSGDVIAQMYPQAFQSYQNAYNQSINAGVTAYSQQQQMSVPFSDTSVAAVNEMRQFLGLRPLESTGGIPTQLNAVAQRLGLTSLPSGNPARGVMFADLAQKVQNAGQLTDAASRAAVGAEINTAFQNIVNPMQFEYEVAGKLNELRQTNPNALKPIVKTDLTNTQLAELVGMDPSQVSQSNLTNMLPALQNWIRSDLTGHGKEAEVFKQQYTDALHQTDAILPEVQSVASNFQQQWKPTEQVGFTGQQVQDKLTKLPEYQFQLQQGTQALERSQAARGELLSGRSMVEATQFGQGLAQNVYNAHIQRLSNLAGITLPTTNQAIANTGNAGSMLSNAMNAYGLNAQASTQAIANARSTAFSNIGQGLLGAATNQAQLNTQANLANAGFAQNRAQGMGQLAGQLMGSSNSSFSNLGTGMMYGGMLGSFF